MVAKTILAVSIGYAMLLFGCMWLAFGILMLRVRRMKASRGTIRIFLRQLTFPLDLIYVHPRMNFFISHKNIPMDIYLKQGSIISMTFCIIVGGGIITLLMYGIITTLLMADNTVHFLFAATLLAIAILTVTRAIFFGHRLGKIRP